MAFSGCYSVGGIDIDVYINDFVKAVFFQCKTIGDFTTELLNSLNREMRKDELKFHTIIHIAGFSEYQGLSHCEHWHISNTGLGGIDKKGNYDKAQETFHLSNDFNTYKKPEDRALLKSWVDTTAIHYLAFYNGFPPGRIAFAIIRKELDRVLAHIWDQNEWKFKAPTNIYEFAHILKVHYEIVGKLFQLSDYRALYIGGETQTHLIPLPQNILLDES